MKKVNRNEYEEDLVQYINENIDKFLLVKYSEDIPNRFSRERANLDLARRILCDATYRYKLINAMVEYVTPYLAIYYKDNLPSDVRKVVYMRGVTEYLHSYQLVNLAIHIDAKLKEEKEKGKSR